MQFQKKPVIIEAAMFDGTLVGEPHAATGEVIPRTCPQWFPAVTRQVSVEPTAMQEGEVVAFDDALYIGTLEGVMKASAGDWIIRGVKNEIYPCKPDIFKETYDYVGETR